MAFSLFFPLIHVLALKTTKNENLSCETFLSPLNQIALFVCFIFLFIFNGSS